MSKSYKIKVNQGGGEAKFVDIPQVSGGGQPLAVKAVPGGKYQLVDASTGYGPENIRASRSGQNLKVFFEGRSQPDLVIEDYYKETPDGFNGLIGESESGRFYEYIPETAAGTSAVPLLADGSNQVGMALGGAEINASGAAVGALVAAAGLNPLLLAPLALLGAAGGGGGGGGGGGDITNNNAAGIKITKATLDTGVSASDFVTKGPVTEFSGTLSTFTGTPGDKVKLELLDKDGKALDPVLMGTVTPVLVSGVWTWKWEPKDTDNTTNFSKVLSENGDYTLKATIVTAAGVAYTHATASTTQVIDIDTKADGPNTAATVEILSISDDTGPSDSDFYTNDQTLKFEGAYTKFTPNGDLIKLELKNENGDVVDTQYIKPEGDSTKAKDGKWSWDRTEKVGLTEGKYKLSATVVDTADNAFKGTSEDLTIDLTGEKIGSGVLSITSMSIDSGVDVATRQDFKTNDNTPEFKGKITDSVTDQWLEVRLHNEADGKDTSKDLFTYIKVPKGTNEWTWSPTTPNGLPDAKYTLTAKVVDQAGNALLNDKGETIGKSQEVVIDTRGPVDPTDPNSGFVMSGIQILGEGDTGQSKTDFITKAGGTTNDLLSFGGSLSGKTGAYDTKAGGAVWLQVINKTTGVLASEGSADVKDNAWSFKTQATLAEGSYIVRATLLDQASNRVSSVDQLLVIDRNLNFGETSTNNADGIKNYLTPKVVSNSSISSFLVVADELGKYVFNQETNSGTVVKFSKEYQGGYFELSDLSGKNFGTSDNFKLSFIDLAGNEKQVINPVNSYNFDSNAILSKAADADHPASLPNPGYTSTQPTVIGNVGNTFKVEGLQEFDMSTLYDGISDIADRAAVNHIDLLTDSKAQTLNISVQDVLALGVGESFLSSEKHAGKIQMRIDGDAKDHVKLTNEFEATGNASWTVNQETTVSLEGISGEYFQATNIASGLELFIKKDVQISIV